MQEAGPWNPGSQNKWWEQMHFHVESNACAHEGKGWPKEEKEEQGEGEKVRCILWAELFIGSRLGERRRRHKERRRPLGLEANSTSKHTKGKRVAREAEREEEKCSLCNYSVSCNCSWLLPSSLQYIHKYPLSSLWKFFIQSVFCPPSLLNQ